MQHKQNGTLPSPATLPMERGSSHMLDAWEPQTEIVNVFSACLAPVIAILAAYIAWRQYRTGCDRLRLDLYERRFRVYRGLMDLLASVLRDGSVSHEALGKYYYETDERRFLFHCDVTDYMQEVKDKAVHLRQVSR